jgi:hypothetical protein
MSKYLNIDGDYKLNVTDGGTITLDTGTDAGTVVVTGDLEVQGTTTTVDTSTLLIEDRVITLNRNGFDTSGKVSDVGGQRVSGLEIDRGSSDAYWVFDENINTEAPGAGAWVGRIGNSGSSGAVVGIRTTSIDTAGTDLFLINQGTGIVSVQGTNNYEQQVFSYDSGSIDFSSNPVLQDDALVNAQGLADYVNGFFTGIFQDRIEEGSLSPTSVEVKDTEVTGQESRVVFSIDNTEVANFFNNRVELQHLRIVDTTIEATSSNSDLNLIAPGAGSVKIDDTLLLTPVPHANDDGTGSPFPNQGFDFDTDNPDSPQAGIKVYAKSEGPAGTSLYFVNSNSTQDELVSKKKSILFSMIF